MRVLLKFWIPLIVVLIVLDFGIGTAMEKLYSAQTKGDIGKINYLLKRSDEKVLFMGSSKTQNGYDPVSFENETGLSAYNAGFAGKITPYHYALLELILDNHNPELIILDITDKDLWDMGMNESFEEISSLSPWYGSNSTVDSLLENASFFERFKLTSKLYPFNSKILLMLKTSDNFFKGHKRVEKAWDSDIEINSRRYDQIGKKRREFIYRFIQRCKEERIKLVLVISPVYMISDGSEFHELKKIAEACEVPVLDMYQEFDIISHKEYFADKTHLNYLGSQIFTELLVERIFTANSE